MTIQRSTFKRDFGRTAGQAPQAQPDRKPAAQVWLNVGYLINEGTDDEKFVALAQGIPLDTMEKLSTRSSNADFAMFQAARNDLHDQFMAEANKLEPGMAVYIHAEGGLSMQIRRVNGEQPEVNVEPNANPFARPGIFANAA